MRWGVAYKRRRHITTRPSLAQCIQHRHWQQGPARGTQHTQWTPQTISIHKTKIKERVMVVKRISDEWVCRNFMTRNSMITAMKMRLESKITFLSKLYVGIMHNIAMCYFCHTLYLGFLCRDRYTCVSLGFHRGWSDLLWLIWHKLLVYAVNISPNLGTKFLIIHFLMIFQMFLQKEILKWKLCNRCPVPYPYPMQFIDTPHHQGVFKK